MSQSTSPQDLKKLTQIKELIRQRRLDEARAALQTMPKNPVARDWLAKLDGPLPRSQSGSIRVTESFPVPAKGKSGVIAPLPTHPNAEIPDSLPILNAKGQGDSLQVLNRTALPIGAPNNPVELLIPARNFGSGYGFGIIGFIALNVIAGAVVMGLRVAENWKRLGKPEWASTSSIVNLFSGILGAGGIIGIILVLGFDVPLEWLGGGSLTQMQAGMLAMGVLSLMAGMNTALMGLQVYLQRSAYKHWYSKGTVESLQSYEYNFDTGCILATVALALCSFLGIAAAIQFIKPTTVDHTLFTLRAASYWNLTDPEDHQEQPICQSRPCQAVLTKGIPYYEDEMTVFLFVGPRNGANHADRFGEQLQVSMQSPTDPYTYRRRYSLMIDGQPASAVEYSYTRFPESSFLLEQFDVISIFVLTPQNVIEVQAHMPVNWDMEGDSPGYDFEAVKTMVEGLDLKNY